MFVFCLLDWSKIQSRAMYHVQIPGSHATGMSYTGSRSCKGMSYTGRDLIGPFVHFLNFNLQEVEK